MSRLSNNDSPTPPDAEFEAELRSYFATNADQPPAVEELWQRLSLQLEEAPLVRSRESIAVAGLDSRRTSMPVVPGNRQLSPTRRRLSALGALAAVLALVVVFALVVHSFLGVGHAPGKSVASKSAATKTLTPTYPNPWRQIAQFSAHNSLLNSGTSVVVGLNDPSVIYELSSPPGLTFQRSDDGGQTWHILSFPGTQVGNATIVASRLFINPLDAHKIWASLIVGPDDPNCSVTAPGTGCTFQYVSTNGGATWAPIPMPLGLVLGFGTLGALDGGVADGLVSAQGDRLYAQLSSGNGNPDPSQSHLATSLDGIHWSIVDNQLTDRSLVVMEYALTPTGSTIFAATALQSKAFSSSSKLDLWRSDDTGARWTNLGTFPLGYPQLLGAAVVNGMTLVYYDNQVAKGDNVEPDHVLASADNGHTWQPAPAIPLSGGQPIYNGVYYGTLANGDVLILFGTSTDNTAMYSWQPGNKSWTQLSQAVKTSSDGSYEGPWYTLARGGRPTELWELTSLSQSSFILWSCTVS
jgi:BNR/Asp-box repeat